jgi:hypothetical protein
MAVNVKLKRSAVPGKIPLTSSLELGELALNTHDGCVYLKRDGINGEEVVKICGNVATDSFIVSDAFTGDGVLTQFTLSSTALADHYSFVTINGVVQHTDAYSISGKTLTLSEEPVTGDAIEIRTFNQQVGSVQLRDYKVYTYQPTVNTATFSGTDIYGNTLAYDLGKVDAQFDTEKRKKYEENIRTIRLKNLENERSKMLQPNFSPNKDWWGSKLIVD